MGTKETLLWLKMVLKIQDLVSQSVSASLPVIATVSAALDNGLIKKIFWILRFFGCPFVGLFY